MEKKNTEKRDRSADFIKLCNDYCKLLEKADKIPLHELLDGVSERLMVIYKYTFTITRLQTRYESEPQKFLTEKQYNKLRKTIMEVLGPRDNYPEFLDPTRLANTNVFHASLSEDLTDIYQDFYDFVTWNSEGTFEAINDSLIECLTNFEKFWGIKLLNILRAIHVIRYLKKDGAIFKDPIADDNDDDDEKLPKDDDDDDDDDDIDPEDLSGFLEVEK